MTPVNQPNLSGQVVLDRNGDLRYGYFYELYIPEYDDFEDWAFGPLERGPQGLDVKAPWPVAERDLPDDELYVHSKLRWDDRSSVEQAHACPQDSGHVTAEYLRDFLVRLDFGPSAADLLRCETDANRVSLVTPRVADALRATPFQGYRLVPIRVGDSEDESYAREAPEFEKYGFVELQFRGRSCFRPLSVIGAPNACPFCGHEPLICPACGIQNDSCPRCNESAWVIRRLHQGAGDRRLILGINWQADGALIVEASRWDGSDFIYAINSVAVYENVVTRRVVDWLLSIHATPFYARAVPVDVTGASPETLERLEAARRLPLPLPAG